MAEGHPIHRLTMRTRPTLIVLAAGQGRRFQGSQHKLSQPLAGGCTVLGTTLRHALETRLPVAVVTTAPLVSLVADQIALRDTIVLADEEAARGMGHSIAVAVAERSAAPGWLVLPADMPLVQPASMLAVAAALDHNAIAYAQHRGRRGHPVGFGAELYSDLTALNGDEGAKRLIARYPACAVELDDPGVLVDVDTVEDLQALRVTGS